jgi:hypothetical protein
MLFLFIVCMFVLLRVEEQVYGEFEVQPIEASKQHEFAKEGNLCP